jgi:diaminohydroxyphosphoribosylaminopyrimidine deaminase/5-amino-6-(5-phosphoribosylamino)uracil reductase
MEFLDVAAELAEKVDWREVYPNPRVGCVIVRDGEVLSTGVHEKCGGAHAEVAALKNLETTNYKLQTSNSPLEVFVTLEPCDYFPGKKTGSCTDALLHLKPKKVIIGAIDPMFGGKNVEKLRAAGITVELVDHERSKALSRKKPYVILKLAQTLDGKIGETTNFNLQTTNLKGKVKNPVYISSLESRKKVHQWRSEVNGILTTTKTVLVDDPLLDCRLANKDIVQDLFVFGASDILKGSRISQFPNRNIFRFEGKDLVRDLREISEMGVQTLLTECGSHMAASLLQQDLVDEIRLFVAPKIFGKGVDVFANEIDLGKFIMTEVEEVGGDMLVRFIRG